MEDLTKDKSLSYLDEDLGNVDTNLPVIKGGIIHEFDIKNVEVQDNKQQTGKNLFLHLATTSPLPSTSGGEIATGHPCYVYIGLTEVVGRPDKKDYTEDDIKRSLARFTLAVHGEKVSVNPLEKHIGKRVMCKVTVSKPTPEYPNEGNNLTFVLPSN